MDITGGLLDHMVLQRTRQGMCDATFTGRAKVPGRVEARISAKGKRARGSGWKVVGHVRNGRLEGRLKGLRTGGPYEISLRVVDRCGQVVDECLVRDILVGDVWILAGQSNMQGCGNLPGMKSRNDMRAFYMDDRWAPAEDPIHDLSIAVDPVHAAICGSPPISNRWKGVGPGVAFGQEMQRLTGVPQGLIACAHGGTSMDQWDPALKKRRGRSLYGAMLRRFQKNGGRVSGVVWYQGCSDANPQTASEYTRKMKKFVSALRRDVGDSRLPVVLVQIASCCSLDTWDGTAWNSIQEQQRLLPKAMGRCLTVPAIDLRLDDNIHISGEDQHRLGRRLADAMCALTKLAPGHKAPMELAGFRLLYDPNRKEFTDIEIRWENVVGALKAQGRPSGFALSDSQGRKRDAIYRTILQGKSVRLKTALSASELKDLRLHYGFGTNPYCNIVDKADRSLPVFGPLLLSPPRVVGPFIRRLRTTKLLPSAEKLHKLKPLSVTDRRLGWRRRKFPQDFCSRHEELDARAPKKDVLIGFACKFRCAKRMRLAIHLGYDGPVKAWIDGKLLLHDPKGVNPASPEDAILKFNASVGTHEIVVALGSNFGKAWGIFLRMQRLDVSKARLARAPERIVMPEVFE